MKRNPTIFTEFLRELNIRHNAAYSDKLFKEHPYRYTLYGISYLLDFYKIPNASLQVNGKDLESLECPFIAHLNNTFVIVTDKINGQVNYLQNEQKKQLSVTDFNAIWSGIVLVAQPGNASGEPNYRNHKIDIRLKQCRDYSLIALAIIGLATAYYSNASLHPVTTLVHIFLNGIGAYICYLILLKQHHVQTSQADRICSLIKKADCGHVLELPASKIFRIFSWGEIGMGYFTANLILLFFFPLLSGRFLWIISTCALPFTLWSIWYQKRIRQWCMLCLAVQVLLWIIFLFNISAYPLSVPVASGSELLTLGIVYPASVLLSNILSEKWTQNIRTDNRLRHLSKIKYTKSVFATLLKQQPHYPDCNSSIIFGNPDAPLGITVFTNPHCEPCAMMHQRIEFLLERMGDSMYVQYIFTSFSQELAESSRFLISAYLQSPSKQALEIYSAWFRKEKYDPFTYMSKFHFQTDDSDVEKEMEKHRQWQDEHQLASTPTVLVNGYKLPPHYMVEDLLYFKGFKEL